VVQRRHRWPGRKRMDDRACLNGILFVLATGIS
jgi:transposase